MVLLEQLGSSLLIQEQNFNNFWNHVFKAYGEFGKQIQAENLEELVADPTFCNDNILEEIKSFLIFIKNGQTKVCVLSRPF